MLKVENLNVAYGQSHIVHDVSFEVKPREIVAVMGRNGMGKSTLLKSLIGMVPPKSGKVEVNGTDVTFLESYRHVENGIAFVPQGRHVFSNLTVEENIRAGLRIKEHWVQLRTEVYSIFDCCIFIIIFCCMIASLRVSFNNRITGIIVCKQYYWGRHLYNSISKHSDNTCIKAVDRIIKDDRLLYVQQFTLSNEKSQSTTLLFRFT